jgi:hypothetical protein
MMMRINFKTFVLLLIVGILSSIFTSLNNCNNSFFLRNTNWKSQFQHKVRFYFTLSYTFLIHLYVHIYYIIIKEL